MSTQILPRMKPREVKWFIRMYLKDLVLQVDAITVFKAIHPSAMKVYNACNNLEKVCIFLQDTKVLADDEYAPIYLFEPFSPMLSARKPVSEILRILETGNYVAEPKYDGERILLHKRGAVIKLLSRNAYDIGNKFDYVKLLSASGALNRIKAHECIIDGELVTWIKKKGVFAPFGSNRRFGNGNFRSGRADKQGEELNDFFEEKDDDLEKDQVDWDLTGDMQLCFLAFDIVWLNGEFLMSRLLRERRQLLIQSIDPIPNLIDIVPQFLVDGRTDVLVELEKTIEMGLEGLIFKNENSRYVPDERDVQWIKLKPDYLDTRANLDLIILGGSFGDGKTGRRNGDISSFLLGLADPDNPGKYFTFSEVGSGYSFSELTELRNKLRPYWIDFNEKRLPNFLHPWKSSALTRPDKLIRPEHSVILEVKAYEITTDKDSNFVKFSASYNLRFPRVIKIRYDKPYDQCENIKNIEKIVKESKGRLNLKIASASEFVSGSDFFPSHSFSLSNDGEHAGLENSGFSKKRKIGTRDIDSTLSQLVTSDTLKKPFLSFSLLFKKKFFCLIF